MAIPQTVAVKPWQPRQAAEAAALHRQVMASPWSEALWSKIAGDGYLGFSLWEQQTLVGVLIFSVIFDEAELQTIALANSAQGRGLATQLLSHGLAALPTATQRIFLEVDSANHRAIALYQRFDFEQCGLRKHYYRISEGNGDAIVMQKIVKE